MKSNWEAGAWESGCQIAGICSFGTDHRIGRGESLLLERGFFFLFVEEGYATISGAYHFYPAEPGDLLILTPSMSCRIHDADPFVRLAWVRIVPEYFDTLPDGQPLYSQLASFLSNYRLPIIRPDEEQCRYLRRTFSLFGEQLAEFHLYRNGIVRHLCEFLLLQATEILGQYNGHTPVYVKRSSEIFRLFRKLLVENYKTHHDIRFYAERLHISTTYLSRIVKRLTGNTVRFHISELICADARRQLECTDREVKEIAAELGFSDQSVFGKFFVAKTGLSPLKFRMSKTREGVADARMQHRKSVAAVNLSEQKKQ